MDYTWHVHETYKTYPEEEKLKLAVFYLVNYLPEDMWSIMALVFEMEISFKPTRLPLKYRCLAIWGNTTDTFGRLKLQLPQNLPFTYPILISTAESTYSFETNRSN